MDPSGLPPDLPPDILGRIPLFAELQKVLSWAGGPVNWDLARQIAVATAASSEHSHRVDPADEAEIAENTRLALLWLGEAAPQLPLPQQAALRCVTPAGWAEHACAAYRELVDPLAAKVSSGIGEHAAQAMGLQAAEAGLQGFDPAMLGQAIAQMAPMLLGVQTGGAIGGVAKDVLGSADVPLPADESGTIAIVVPSVDRLAADYGLDRRETRLFATLREIATRAVVDALRGPFFAAYLDYVASLSIDFAGAFERLQGIDLTDPSRLESDMAERGFFEMLDAPASGEASGRLQLLMALAEAVAARAVESATSTRLPSASRVAEAVARTRAESDGVPALRRFIGVGTGEDGRRDANAFTRAVLERSGWDALSRIWERPETIPSRDDLARPDEWLERTST